MSIRPVVFLVVYGAQIEIGLQLVVRAFYFSSKVVIVPCGLLVKRRNVGSEEIDAALFVHVLRNGDAPLYVSHVLCLDKEQRNEILSVLLSRCAGIRQIQ